MSFSPATAQALDRFARTFQRGRLAHAYLVVGAPRGDGLAFATEAVSHLFCVGEAKPCHACPGCRQVAERIHPDVVWVEPRKKSRTIGVDEVRDIQRRVYQTAYAGGWKACVLSHADRLGEEAANAFLKTLEEPPAQCLFLLLTDSPQAVMPTVASRCQRVVLTTELDALPGSWHTAVESLLADAAAEKAGSAMLTTGPRWLALLAALRAEIEAEEKAAVEETSDEVDTPTLEARIEARYRERRTMVLRLVSLWHRDVLARVCGAGSGVLHFPGRLQEIDRVAGRLTWPEAVRNTRTVEEMHRRLERNLPQESVIQWGIEELAAPGKGAR